MKLSPLALYVSYHHRSYGCSAAAGGGSDLLRRCIRPVSPAQTSGATFGTGTKPPSVAAGKRLTSSALIAQWQQRRRVCSSAPALALRSQNIATGEALADCQLSISPSTASQGPSTMSSPSSSSANTSDSTADMSEASIVAQLQMLTKQYRGKRKSCSGNVVADSGDTAADVPVLAKSAGVSANLLSNAVIAASDSRNDSTVALAHNGEPAWQRGLRLVQTTSCATVAVMEWLLFLCLRSSQAATDTAGLLARAPLEVCEGVYSAWRALHRAQLPESGAAAEATGSATAAVPPASDSPSSGQAHRPCCCSPFSPKGVHHHYATHLLRELHNAQAAAASCKVRGEGSSGTNGHGDNYSTPAPANGSDAAQVAWLHRAHYLLNRALEALLVHLPQDAAAAAATLAGKATEQTYGMEGARSRKSRKCRAVLRPTTALLVLEAARHAARLRRQSSMLSDVGPSDNVALLSCLWKTAHCSASTQDAAVASSSPAHSALAAVARETFETIMKTSAAEAIRTFTGSSQKQQQHRLQDDALVLYVGFLATICAPPVSESCLVPELQSIECFVLAGSPTARQFSSPSQQRPVLRSWPPMPFLSADETPHDQSESASTATALAAAAGVRWLLATYLSPPSPSLVPASEPRAEARRRQSDFVRDAVVAALSRSKSLLASSSQEPPSVAHTQNQDVGVVQPRASPSATPWCAWMLRALIHDDALQQQKRGSEAAPFEGITPSSTGGTSTLELAILLVMELRRHSQVTLASHGSSGLKEDRQHRRAKLARRLQQLVWAVLLDAAVRGQLGLADYCRAAADSGLATLHRAQTRSRPRRGTPAVLQRLCYPHYDKTQWRRGSVNLYMQLLDQWGESAQVRQVFATVARRERESQVEVHETVLAERRELVTLGDEAGGCGKDSCAGVGGSIAKESGVAKGQAAASTATVDSYKTVAARVFRRYRPTLNLESCLITLRHCGCPARVLAELWEGPACARDGNDGSDDAPVTAAQAKLAGEVLQYMVCSLHVWARRPRAPSADDDLVANLANNMMEVEGLPLSQWVAWIRSSCVPALAHLYRSAGVEDEWEELRYRSE
ncbi:hypothetical protein LSCM4_05122 [Leishmania orientalis]|uniref:Uncharacterized protein n=1 Tax=Leishmania orientalis TaxID=2249476 RepID=A0A836H6X6_9TRYP|nr:hypothetical protein LSCM4_05122 [Leishmania orientalis]